MQLSWSSACLLCRAPHKLDMVVNSSNPSTREVEVGLQGRPGLDIEFWASLQIGLETLSQNTNPYFALKIKAEARHGGTCSESQQLGGSGIPGQHWLPKNPIKERKKERWEGRRRERGRGHETEERKETESVSEIISQYFSEMAQLYLFIKCFCFYLKGELLLIDYMLYITYALNFFQE